VDKNPDRVTTGLEMRAIMNFMMCAAVPYAPSSGDERVTSASAHETKARPREIE
jgi:hypothetical protein